MKAFGNTERNVFFIQDDSQLYFVSLHDKAFIVYVEEFSNISNPAFVYILRPAKPTQSRIKKYE